MDGAQEDSIFAELGNLGGEFEVPCSPTERERSSRAERERAHMKWRFSVYSLLAQRCRRNLWDVHMTQAIVNTTGPQNSTATTDVGVSVKEGAAAPFLISSPPVDVASGSEALHAESGDTRTEEAYVGNGSDHDLQFRIETLLKMDRESEQWSAANAGIIQEMRKHTEESSIVDDLEKQREKLTNAKATMQRVSLKLEKDLEKNSTELRELLQQMRTFASQTYGIPFLPDRIHGHTVTTLGFISGVIEVLDRLLKRLRHETFTIIQKITKVCQELGRGELSALKIFQCYDNSIRYLVQTLLGKQESKFISLTTIKKWYRDIDQADACTRVLIPPDILPWEQTPCSSYASPS